MISLKMILVYLN